MGFLTGEVGKHIWIIVTLSSVTPVIVIKEGLTGATLPSLPTQGLTLGQLEAQVAFKQF